MKLKCLVLSIEILRIQRYHYISLPSQTFFVSLFALRVCGSFFFLFLTIHLLSFSDVFVLSSSKNERRRKIRAKVCACENMLTYHVQTFFLRIYVLHIKESIIISEKEWNGKSHAWNESHTYILLQNQNICSG